MNSQAVTVEFQGATLEGVIHQRKNFVAMKAIAEGMGLAWNGQLAKMKAQPALAATMQEICIVALDGKARSMVCLPEEMLPFWLALVHPNKVKPELKEKVIRYQIEAAKVLHKAFTKGQEEIQDWTKDRREAAGRYSVMSDVLKESREDQGKETKSFHYANEALMINEILTGVRGPLQRDTLTRVDLKILSRLEAKNTVLIGRDYPYQYRKAILARFSAEERARLTMKVTA